MSGHNCPKYNDRGEVIHPKRKITLVGCPKLDGVDYTEKLTEIISANDIQSVTIVRMEVPLLRRAGNGREASPAKQRKVHSLAGGNGFD